MIENCLSIFINIKKEGNQLMNMADQQQIKTTGPALGQHPAVNPEQANESMNVSNDEGQEDGEEELEQ